MSVVLGGTRCVSPPQPISTFMAKSQDPTPFLPRPIIIRPSASSVWPCAGRRHRTDAARDFRGTLDARLCLRIVGRVECVERAALSKNVTKDGVERLNDTLTGGDDPGHLLRTRTVVGGDEAREVGGNRIGDVYDRLAVERASIVSYRCRRTGIRHGKDDDVARRRGAIGPRGRTGCPFVGQRPGPGGGTADHLDGASRFDDTAGDRCGRQKHAARQRSINFFRGLIAKSSELLFLTIRLNNRRRIIRGYSTFEPSAAI